MSKLAVIDGELLQKNDFFFSMERGSTRKWLARGDIGKDGSHFEVIDLVHQSGSEMAIILS